MEFAPKLNTKHSHVVQRKISRPSDALAEFEKIGADGNIPVVLVPKYPWFFHFMLKFLRRVRFVANVARKQGS